MDKTTAVAPSKRTPFSRLVNSTAIASLVRSGGVALDSGAKKLVSDSITSGAEPTSADKEAAGLNRHSLLAALSWLKRAGSKIASLVAPRPRPGAYQRRRPLAKPFVNKHAEAERLSGVSRVADAMVTTIAVPTIDVKTIA